MPTPITIASLDLIARGARVDDPPGIDDRNDPIHAKPGDFGLPRNLDELRAVRVERKFRMLFAEGSRCLFRSRHHRHGRILQNLVEVDLLGARPLRATILPR